MTTAESTLSFDIAFSSQWWSFISSTRIFVSSFCGHSIGDPDFSDRVAMATHELLENAVKYSAAHCLPVKCQVGLDEGHMWVRVQNEAEPAHIESLRRVFTEVSDGNPIDVYIQKMQASVMSDKSELGLARVRYEAGADLRMDYDGKVVTLEALFGIPKET